MVVNELFLMNTCPSVVPLTLTMVCLLVLRVMGVDVPVGLPVISASFVMTKPAFASAEISELT